MSDVIILCLAAFGAGFIDSVVGGGGLIQLPALLLAFPHLPVVTLLGTNKMVSVAGTAFSAYRFSRQVPFQLSLMMPAILTAFVSSFAGAYVVSLVSNDFLKPIFILMMVLIFFLTIRNRHFGMKDQDPSIKIPMWKPVSVGLVLGFYDGFFGPGMGTLLIIAYVGLMGMTFVQGSASAKIINLTTNVAAICFFMMKGSILWNTAILMMVFNVAGAVVGVRMALLKGNDFVRGLLRFIVLAMIIKTAYEVWRDYL